MNRVVAIAVFGMAAALALPLSAQMRGGVVHSAPMRSAGPAMRSGAMAPRNFGSPRFSGTMRSSNTTIRGSTFGFGFGFGDCFNCGFHHRHHHFFAGGGFFPAYYPYYGYPYYAYSYGPIFPPETYYNQAPMNQPVIVE